MNSKEEKYKKVFKSWYPKLEEWGCIELLDGIERDLALLYENTTVYPKVSHVFRAFKELEYDDCKAVLLGQDPYPNEYKGVPSACGLAFATENGFINFSLRAIMKELKDDIGYSNRYKVDSEYEGQHKGGKLARNLLDWPSEGVLLLNTALTVEAGSPKSHSHVWEEWTNRLVKGLGKDRPDIVWILLGGDAKSYDEFIDSKDNIVRAAHPAAEAYNKGDKKLFFGSKVFSRTNKILEDQGIVPINW